MSINNNVRVKSQSEHVQSIAFLVSCKPAQGNYQGRAEERKGKERKRNMPNDAPYCPEWMNSEQCAIYRELRQTCNAVCAALERKDQNTWLRQTMRLREITRMARQTMFTQS